MAITAFVALAALAVSAVYSAREAARRSQCVNTLGQIGLGIFNDHDMYRSLPPARTRHLAAKDQPLCSWRVLITPFFTSSPFYMLYHQDEPWSSENNLKLSPQLQHLYHCPSDASAVAMTSYVAVVGPRTAWPGETSSRWNLFPYSPQSPAAQQAREPPMTMASGPMLDFSKGMSNTVLLVEVADSGIHWMEPRDLEFDKIDFTVHGPMSRAGQGISSEHPGGANTLFSDGHVGFVSAEVAPEALKAMLTIPGHRDSSPQR